MVPALLVEICEDSSNTISNFAYSISWVFIPVPFSSWAILYLNLSHSMCTACVLLLLFNTMSEMFTMKAFNFLYIGSTITLLSTGFSKSVEIQKICESLRKYGSFVLNVTKCRCDGSNQSNTVVTERNFRDYISKN